MITLNLTQILLVIVRESGDQCHDAVATRRFFRLRKVELPVNEVLFDSFVDSLDFNGLRRNGPALYVELMKANEATIIACAI